MPKKLHKFSLYNQYQIHIAVKSRKKIYKTRRNKNLNLKNCITRFTFTLKSTTKIAKLKSTRKLKIDEYNKDKYKKIMS